MRDARVREHPLRIRLRERDDVAAGHGDRGQDREDRAPIHAERTERAKEDAEDRRESGRFGADRHERGGRGRCAVVSVGRPLMERHDRGFEAQTDRDERERDDGRTVRDPLPGEDVRDRDVVGRLRDPVEPHEPVKE